MEKYTSYIDSEVGWIGEIPSHWTMVNLSVLGRPRKNKNEGNKETNVLSLSYGRIKQRVLDNTGLLPESFETYNIIEPGDVVLRLTDLQNDQVSLRVGRTTERGIITSAYTTLEPVEAESRYLFYLLASFDHWKGFYGLAGGVRQGLNFDGIRALKYPLPPRNEQIAIADYLDKKLGHIDNATEEIEKTIDLLREYRQSVISEAVTRGLNSGTQMKNADLCWISHIPLGWRVVPLKSLFSYGKGLPITKADLSDEGVPVISYGQIHSKANNPAHVVDEIVRFVPASYLETNAASFANEGDFIFADTSEDVDGCGNFIHVDRKEGLFAGYHTILFKPADKNYSRYLSYLFQSQEWRSQIRSKVCGVKLFSVTQRVLSGVNVIIPPQPEQARIADYLDSKTESIDKLVRDKQKQVELLKEYRRSLISEAVTGKFKVPGLE